MGRKSAQSEKNHLKSVCVVMQRTVFLTHLPVIIHTVILLNHEIIKLPSLWDLQNMLNLRSRTL